MEVILADNAQWSREIGILREWIQDKDFYKTVIPKYIYGHHPMLQQKLQEVI